MGRVQADIPEESKSTDGPDSPAADDLLSQLAGEDIDRMLAEAEVEASPIPAPSVAAAAPQSNPFGTDSKESTEDLDSLMKEMDGARASTNDAAASSTDDAIARAPAALLDAEVVSEDANATASDAGAAGNKALADESGASATQSESSPVPSNPADSANAPSADQSPAIGSAHPPSESEVGNPPQASPANIGKIGQVAGSTADAGDAKSISAAPAVAPKTSAEPALSAATPEAVQPAAEDDGPLPFYIRLLEVLNSPLDGLSDAVRGAIGKVALVTFLNAIVVIGYVLIFRRK